jgi:multidrug efflux pump subunit AcrB
MEEGPRLAHLDRIAVSSPAGSAIPLQQLATVEFEPAPARIDHFELERAVSVTADVADGYNVAAVTQEAVDRLRALEWPRGYRMFVGGELEALGESFGGLARALVVALVGILGVLVLQFRSFVQPLVVFSAIPLAVVGSLGALLITGYSFSFMAFVGLAALVGVVVNNSIILVDFANGRRAEGVALRDGSQVLARSRDATAIQILVDVPEQRDELGFFDLPPSLQQAKLNCPWIVGLCSRAPGPFAAETAQHHR